MIKSEADYLFETSWEVCNKVGGIYTVVKSKSLEMTEHYKNYFLIGPYFENNAKLDFVKQETPELFKKAFENLKTQNILCYFGKWDDAKGSPFAILIDFRPLISRKDELKKMYWEDYQIDSLRGYWDYEEPMIWAYCVGRLIEEIYKTALYDKNVVAQFHEWLSAFALLYLKKNCKKVATVFTTHATTLGRTLAGNGRDLYAIYKNINPDQEAYTYSVEAKHLTEKAAALTTDVFTTVSEITAMEAEAFLGRKPEILVLNGLDIEKFPTIEENSIKHIACRDKIREFLTYYFFPYYQFDIDRNLIFYIVGRNEFRNKGIDITINSLGQLNQKLKDTYLSTKDPTQKSRIRTVSVFFWIPMQHQGLKVEVLENKNYYMHIKNYVNWNSSEILRKLIYDFVSKKENIHEDMFSETFLKDIKRNMIVFERKGNPPLTTHNIFDENNNEIIKSLKENGLLNRKDDFVKVIVQPIYLDGTDGFIDLNYYDAMSGCHLGLFPSYYEPWGYTPLESAALSVPAITSDLSGFGMFIKKETQEKNAGIFVLERWNKPEQAAIEQYTQIMYDFLNIDHSERVKLKVSAKALSALADWDVLIDNYIAAHNLALKNNNEKNLF